MQVTVLGTMGWMPGQGRETTCTAFRDGSELFLFDAGTGLRRLLEPAHRRLVSDISRVHLFLSHYHLDHTSGLAYLPGVLPGRCVVLHPPAKGMTGVDPKKAIAGLLGHPYNPRDLDEIEELTLEPLNEGSNKVGDHEIRARRQRHSDASVCWRIDDIFVQATDTIADPALVKFAAGTQLLMHEAWYASDDPHLKALPQELLPGFAAHSEAGAVARLAASAGVRRLVLIHLNPLLDAEGLTAMADQAKRVFGNTMLVDDGEVIPVTGI